MKEEHKLIRCKDCAYGIPDGEKVHCVHFGKQEKTNSCTKRKERKNED